MAATYCITAVSRVGHFSGDQNCAHDALGADRMVMDLGTLVPVIGFVQVGSQAMADRYTYIPYLGIFIAVTWTVSALQAGFLKAIRRSRRCPRRFF